MDLSSKQELWKQFGAAIDMFENSIRQCPQELWDAESKIWYKAYHTLYFLNHYLTFDPKDESFPQPFPLPEFEDGNLPDRVYSKEELLEYLEYCRKKLHDLLADPLKETSGMRWSDGYRNYGFLEMMLYNMRHVQHHTAQLNLQIRQSGNVPHDWVSRTKTELKTNIKTIRKKRSKKELWEVSEHVGYEFTMFYKVVDLIKNNLDNGSQDLINILTELFTLRTRTLTHFFFPQNPRIDDILAEDFFDDPKDWINLTDKIPTELEAANFRVGKEIAHLTYHRKNVTKEKKLWDIGKLGNSLNKFIILYWNNVPKEIIDLNQFPIHLVNSNDCEQK